jgi:hypothetical protein
MCMAMCPKVFFKQITEVMFESYAEDVLRSVGVITWDITGESAMGDYKPHDFVHCDGPTAWKQNADMFDLTCTVGM